MLNRSTIKNIGRGIISETSSINALFKTDCEIDFTIANTTANYSDDRGEILKHFNIDEIPEIFRKEKDLVNLYDYIFKNKTVSMDLVSKKFNQISNEKLDIFISLLCRKNFIKLKGGKLSIEK